MNFVLVQRALRVLPEQAQCQASVALAQALTFVDIKHSQRSQLLTGMLLGIALNVLSLPFYNVIYY